MQIRISHLGLCVTDMEASTRFYCEGLGFVSVSRWHHDPTMKDGPGDNALEVAEPTLHGHYIALGDVTLELLWFEHPGHVGEPVRRPMNQLGLTHVALRVDDLNLVTQRIREFGGTVLEDTRVDFELPHAKGSTVFCTDPDGTRLEINLRTYQEHGTPDPITGLYL